MTKSEAIAFYKTGIAMAKAAGVDQSTPYSWGVYPPDHIQLRLERDSGGKLVAEPGCFERATGLADKAGA